MRDHSKQVRAPQPAGRANLRHAFCPPGGPLFTSSSSCSLQPFDTHTPIQQLKQTLNPNQPTPPTQPSTCLPLTPTLPTRASSVRSPTPSPYVLPLTLTLHPSSLANNTIRTPPTTLPRPSRAPPPLPPRRPTRSRPRVTSPARTPSPTVPLAPLTPLATRSTRRSTRAPPRPTSRASKCTLLDEQWYAHLSMKTTQAGAGC
jgi:hypothetical protein